MHPQINTSRRPRLSKAGPIMGPPTPFDSQRARSQPATSVTDQFTSFAMAGMFDAHASMLEITGKLRPTTGRQASSPSRVEVHKKTITQITSEATANPNAQSATLMQATRNPLVDLLPSLVMDPSVNRKRKQTMRSTRLHTQNIVPKLVEQSPSPTNVSHRLGQVINSACTSLKYP